MSSFLRGDTDFLKKKPTILFETLLPPGLRMVIPDRALWNGRVFQGQKGIPIFTDGSKLDGGTVAGVFCRELDLHLRLKNDCSVFKVEIFQS